MSTEKPKRTLPKFIEREPEEEEAKRECAYCKTALPHDDEDGHTCELCDRLFCDECCCLCYHCDGFMCIECIKIEVRALRAWLQRRGEDA